MPVGFLYFSYSQNSELGQTFFSKTEMGSNGKRVASQSADKSYPQ